MLSCAISPCWTDRRYWFTAGEEAEIQHANVAFYRTCPAEEAFARHFRAARPDEEALSVSLPELIALLRKRQPGTLTGIGMQEFSRALVAAGVERKHTEKGNRSCRWSGRAASPQSSLNEMNGNKAFS